MKIVEMIAKAINKVWNFISLIAIIGLISAVVLFGISVFMPDNVVKVIEIIKGLL
jgi:ABC-type phosphate transport system auxiliary subunit